MDSFCRIIECGFCLSASYRVWISSASFGVWIHSTSRFKIIFHSFFLFFQSIKIRTFSLASNSFIPFHSIRTFSFILHYFSSLVDDLLVAKRSSPVNDSTESLVSEHTPTKSVRSAIVIPRRIAPARIAPRRYPPRKVKFTNFKRPVRTVKNGRKPVPKLTPKQRAELFEESDTDVLTVTEEIDLGESSSTEERGRLLHLSTRKPKARPAITVKEVDAEPKNCTDTTKRIVRIVQRPQRPPTLDIEVRTATREFGVQVGIPLHEYIKRQRSNNPSASAPPVEVPLQGYWTHKVNLPYPPDQFASAPPQFVVPQQQQQFAQPFVQPFQQQQFVQPYGQAQFQQAPFAQPQQPLSRQQKRNFVKHQKYMQRKQM